MGKHSNAILTYHNNKIIDCLKRVSPSMSARNLQPGAIYQKPPLIEKYNPYTTDWIETDNLTKTYQGFSPELSKEVYIAWIMEKHSMILSRYSIIPQHCIFIKRR